MKSPGNSDFGTCVAGFPLPLLDTGLPFGQPPRVKGDLRRTRIWLLPSPPANEIVAGSQRARAIRTQHPQTIGQHLFECDSSPHRIPRLAPPVSEVMTDLPEPTRATFEATSTPLANTASTRWTSSVASCLAALADAAKR